MSTIPVTKEQSTSVTDSSKVQKSLPPVAPGVPEPLSILHKVPATSAL